jgi:hypothetical protein
MRTNFAPRLPTILVAIVLTLIGVAGTFLGILPTIGGLDSVTLGVWAYVASFVILVIGIIFRGV